MSMEIIGEMVDKVIQQERERCAKIAEQFPSQILVFVDRPGGPPGNFYRPSTGEDIAAAIRKS